MSAEKEEQSIPLDTLVAEGAGDIVKLHSSVNFQNLLYHFKVPLKI